ncbi:GSCOCG00011757001-RA-CDS, partial [Cotesia congregata]
MRDKESVLSYYHRIKKIRANAIASLREHFVEEEEVTTMTKLLDGLALESFKRGLPDDLVYGVSVQNPANLDDAYKIALRLEEDLKSNSTRNSNYLAYTQLDPDVDPPRRTRTISFQDEERRGQIPFRLNRNSRSPSPAYRQTNRDNSREHQRNRDRSMSPYRSPPNYYPYLPSPGYLPPMHYMPYQFSPPFPYSHQMPYSNPYHYGNQNNYNSN